MGLKKLPFLLIGILLFIPLVFAFGYTTRDVPDTPVNYSAVATVNASELWVTAEGILDDVSDISHSWLSDLAWSVAGHTMDTDLDMGGNDIHTVNDLDVDNDVYIADQLEVDGDLWVDEQINLTGGDLFVERAGNINVTGGGNVSASYFFGDGAYLTSLNITGDISGYALNTSFLYGSAGIGGIDMRGDPWYFAGADWQFASSVDIDYNLNVDGNVTIGENLTVEGNVSASYFFGNGSQLTDVEGTLYYADEDWINKNTSNAFVFNSSMLDTTFFNASDIEVITGTPQGTLANIQTYNGVSYNVSEVASDIDFIVNFTDVDDFNQLIIRYRSTEEDDPHVMSVQIFEPDEDEWEDYGILPAMGVYHVVEFGVYDSDEHIDGTGNVSVRFVQDEGVPPKTHKHEFDWVALAKGFGTPAPEEVDPIFNAWLLNPILEYDLSMNGNNIFDVGVVNTSTLHATTQILNDGDYYGQDIYADDIIMDNLIVDGIQHQEASVFPISTPSLEPFDIVLCAGNTACQLNVTTTGIDIGVTTAVYGTFRAYNDIFLLGGDYNIYGVNSVYGNTALPIHFVLTGDEDEQYLMNYSMSGLNIHNGSLIVAENVTAGDTIFGDWDGGIANNPINIISTTAPQLKIIYDANGYASLSVDTSGDLTFDYGGSAGAVSQLIFHGNSTVGSGIIFNDGGHSNALSMVVGPATSTFASIENAQFSSNNGFIAFKSADTNDYIQFQTQSNIPQIRVEGDADLVVNLTTSKRFIVYNDSGGSYGGVVAGEFITMSELINNEVDYLSKFNLEDFSNKETHPSAVDVPFEDVCSEELIGYEYCPDLENYDWYGLECSENPTEINVIKTSVYDDVCSYRNETGLSMESRIVDLEGAVIQLKDENNLMKVSLCRLGEIEWC